jgi:hypothetical protein
MSLVNDHRAVLWKRCPTMHGIDRQQCMIGNYEVSRAGRVSRALNEAFRAIRTALHT